MPIGTPQTHKLGIVVEIFRHDMGTGNQLQKIEKVFKESETHTGEDNHIDNISHRRVDQ